MFTGNFDIMLYVTDFARSAEFYTGTLGFSVTGFWSDDRHDYFPTLDAAGQCAYVKLSAGGAGVALHAADSVAGRGGVYHFEVQDVDAYRAALSKRGAGPEEIRDFPWGWRMFFVADPDNHLLGFYTPGSAADATS